MSHPAFPRRSGRLCGSGFALMVLVLVLGLAPSAQARTDNNLKVVSFVHGFELGSSNNCESTWGTLFAELRGRYGFANSFNPIQYYAKDTTCSSRGTMPTGHPAVINGYIGNYSSDSRIGDISKSYAWYLYNTFSRYDRTVDIVGHSMGGLIVRFALTAVERRLPGWPPYLLVEDVVTLGTPHNGTRSWPSKASFCPDRIYGQCGEMESGSGLITYLNYDGKNPQAWGGTNWTLIGSSDDNTVSPESAVGQGTMTVFNRLKYINQNIGHSDYMNSTRTNSDAFFQWWRSSTSTWMNQGDGDWPVKETQLALQSAVN